MHTFLKTNISFLKKNKKFIPIFVCIVFPLAIFIFLILCPFLISSEIFVLYKTCVNLTI